MFTSIRKYKVRHGSAEELARRVRESFVPLLRQMPGFQSYYLLDVRNNVLEFTKGMPEVMVGNTLIAEVKE